MLIYLQARSARLASVVAMAALIAPTARGQSDDRPPREFVRAWQEAVGGRGKSQQEALVTLGANPAWEPYLRTAHNQTTDRALRQLLRPALIKCQADLARWNLNRAEEWGKQLRLDYVTSLAAAIDDEEGAARLGQLFVTAQRTLYERFWEVGPWNPKNRLPAWSFLHRPDYATMTRLDGFGRVSGDHVSVLKEYRPAFIHANTGDIGIVGIGTWISATQRQLSEPDKGGSVWLNSVVCVNNDISFRSVSNTLIVCDGNVELELRDRGGGHCGQCAIISNGDVTLAEGFELNGVVIYAAGDFVGRPEIRQSAGAIMTGGKNSTVLEPAKSTKFYDKYYKQGVKENPLGVKFVSPADAGVELDVAAKVVRLGNLTDASPLAKAELKKGDRVLTLNGLRMETEADFRRQLRESLLWGTGLFEIKRGDQTFHRLVKFAEPPKK